ncbi:MAG: type II secretion system protein N [Pseudoxanthomonas sp.]
MIGARRFGRGPNRIGAGTRSGRRWRWAIAGAVIGGLAVILWQLPAAWIIAPAVARASGQRLQLLAVQGSVWNGSAVVALTGNDGKLESLALPGRLQWRLRPAWDRRALIGIGLAADLDQPCCLQGPARLRIAWTPRQLVVDMPAIAWKGPAAWLAGLGTPWNTIAPEGLLTLTLHNASFSQTEGRPAFSGQAMLEVHDVVSRLSPIHPLGSYRLALTGRAGKTPRLEMSTTSGVLQISGQGTFANGYLHFNGQAQAAAGHEAALANLLDIIGRRQGAISVISFG